MNISVKKVNSLGFSKPCKDTKVVVAMSGGVDSSTVAGIMKKEGKQPVSTVNQVSLKPEPDLASNLPLSAAE